MYETEKEKISMPVYTRRELEDLKTNLYYYEISITSDYRQLGFHRHVEKVNYDYVKENYVKENMYVQWLARIKYGKDITDIEVKTLFELLKPSCKMVFNKESMLFKLYTFIRVKFKDVALYINDFPDFVSWRLRIGK